ncbi:MAG: histidine phosphatase family protein [Brachymonas sp.]
MTRLLVIRHGETDWNAQRRVQGHTDIALNDTGKRQASLLAQTLADSPHHVIAALRERRFGSIEGQVFADFEQQHPEAAFHWRMRTPHWQPPGDGESLLALRERVERAVHGIATRHPGQQVAIVSHGGVLDVLYRAATRQELQAARTWALPHCAINRLLWTPDGLTLIGWGDVSHLD